MILDRFPRVNYFSMGLMSVVSLGTINKLHIWVSEFVWELRVGNSLSIYMDGKLDILYSIRASEC